MNPSQELLAGAALTSFRLNGQFLEIAEELARPVGLTAAWWQVLGAVLETPLPVSGVARAMGMSRQAVQRVADLLVDRGLATYQENPAHRRAKLVVPTDAGRDAVRRIIPQHRRVATALANDVGRERLSEIVAAMRELTTAMERLAP